MNKANVGFSSPPLPLVLLLQLLWGLGTVLLLLVMTNFFSETPFRSNNFMLWFLIVFSALSVLRITRNYFNSIKK
jgi:hypothetical protein